jgi:hypothetical protein
MQDLTPALLHAVLQFLPCREQLSLRGAAAAFNTAVSVYSRDEALEELAHLSEAMPECIFCFAPPGMVRLPSLMHNARRAHSAVSRIAWIFRKEEPLFARLRTFEYFVGALARGSPAALSPPPHWRELLRLFCAGAPAVVWPSASPMSEVALAWCAAVCPDCIFTDTTQTLDSMEAVSPLPDNCETAPLQGNSAVSPWIIAHWLVSLGPLILPHDHRSASAPWKELVETVRVGYQPAFKPGRGYSSSSYHFRTAVPPPPRVALAPPSGTGDAQNGFTVELRQARDFEVLPTEHTAAVYARILIGEAVSFAAHRSSPFAFWYDASLLTSEGPSRRPFGPDEFTLKSLLNQTSAPPVRLESHHPGTFGGVRTVTLPSKGLVEIRGESFLGAPELREIIGLDRCRWLRQNTRGSLAGNAIESIDLSGCTSLASIAQDCFGRCPYLTRVVLPASLVTIEGGAFAFCEALEHVDFSRCTQLANVDGRAFVRCNGMKVLDLSRCAAMTNMSECFQACRDLCTVIMPPGIKVIGPYTLSNCVNLTTVDFSRCKSLQRIHDDAFGSNPHMSVLGLESSDAAIPQSILARSTSFNLEKVAPTVATP